MSEENKKPEGSEELLAGKFKSKEDLEKGYLELQKKLSAGEHKKEPETPPKTDSAAMAKEVAKLVAQAMKDQQSAAKEQNTDAVKKLIKDTPDGALSLKKALYTEDGKQEKDYFKKIEAGEISPQEVKILMDQGRQLEEPPSFLDAILKKTDYSKDDFARDSEALNNLLADSKWYHPKHPDHKKNREKTMALQKKLGLEVQDFSDMANWKQGVHTELASESTRR